MKPIPRRHRGRPFRGSCRLFGHPDESHLGIDLEHPEFPPTLLGGVHVGGLDNQELNLLVGEFPGIDNLRIIIEERSLFPQFGSGHHARQEREKEDQSGGGENGFHADSKVVSGLPNGSPFSLGRQQHPVNSDNFLPVFPHNTKNPARRRDFPCAWSAYERAKGPSDDDDRGGSTRPVQ